MIEAAASIGCIVSGAYASSYALKNPSIGDDSYSNKCIKYIAFWLSGASAWVTKNGKFADYLNMNQRFGKKGNKRWQYI